MNDARFDQLLYDALLEANRQDYKDITDKEISVAWSASYERQRRNMLHDPMGWYRRKTAPAWKRIGMAVASILLVIIVGFSTVLAISPVARAQFFAWVQEIYETHIVYRFLGEPVTEEMPQYEITSLPNEFREADRFVMGNQVSVTYQNDVGETIFLDYVRIQQGTASFVLRDGMSMKDTVVNSCRGQVYLSQTPDQSNAIIWVDETKNLQFTIDAHAEEEMLLSYSCHVELKK